MLTNASFGLPARYAFGQPHKHALSSINERPCVMKLHIVVHESFESPAAIDVWARSKNYETGYLA